MAENITSKTKEQHVKIEQRHIQTIGDLVMAACKENAKTCAAGGEFPVPVGLKPPVSQTATAGKNSSPPPPPIPTGKKSTP
jgi:hypothetical protein